MPKRIGMLISAILLGVALSGCGGKEAKQAEDVAPETFTNEPVTVTLYSHYAAINTDKDLDDLFGRSVRAKYPNITIELVKGVKLQDLIAAGEVPDLIATTHYYMGTILPLGIGSDLNDFVKKYKIDLNRFVPEAIQAVKMYGKNGELYGIPYTLNYGLLIYNKDIFNKFAAPYPTDGMTWNELIELARKLTRVDNGTQYIGLDPGSARTVGRAYSLGTVDEKQEKAVLNSEGFRKVYGILKQIYDMPGYVNKNKYSYGIDYFIKDQKLAMFPSWLAAITSRLPQLNEPGKSFDWDIAAHPVFDDRPGIGREIEFQSLMVPPNSKNREAAYRIIQTVVSEEAQRAMNSENTLTILDDPKLRAEFGSKTELYKGKNLAGIFKVKPAPSPIPSEFDEKLYSFLGEATKSMVLEKQDINTVLRIANEKGDKYIQSVKSQ